MIDRQKYAMLNDSFPKKLVYFYGDSAGFFSEFNNMALAVLYCLQHKIRFAMYTSGNDKLSITKGWNDFFVPFCDQESHSFHKKYNSLYKSPGDKKKSVWHRFKRLLIKKIFGIDYFTYEIWDEFRNLAMTSMHFSIPELGIDDDFHEAYRKVIEMMWVFSPETEEAIRSVIASLDLPAKYTGMHVRAGDKITESSLYNPESYIKKLKASPKGTTHSCFILTDDYSVYRLLEDSEPEYAFSTLCRPDEKGYDFYALSKKSPSVRYSEYIKLLASVEILRKAVVTVGTYSTNPGMFLGIMMESGDFIGIDSDKWLLW